MNFRHPKESIVIQNDSILFIGTTEEVLEKFKCSQVVDLKGKTVLPGIHDVHMHPLEVGNPVAGTCKLPHMTKPESHRMRQAFKNYHSKMKGSGTDWSLGWGHSIESFLEHIQTGGKAPKLILDDYINKVGSIYGSLGCNYLL